MDSLSHIIDVRGLLRGTEAALRDYEPGKTVPVRVRQVEAAKCQVELFPGFTVPIDAADIADRSDLRLVTSRGEVLLALVVEREKDTWLLSVKDAADAEHASLAASLLPGGPPWLVPPSPPSGDGDVAAEAAAEEWLRGLDGMDDSVPEDLPGAIAEIGSLRRELYQATRQAARLEGELKTAREQLENARTSRRQAEIARDKAERRGGGRPSGGERLFEDPAEQLDFEIRAAWARRIPASDKKARPLAEWGYSDHFFETLDSLKGIDRSKIVDVIVEVLTGLDKEMPGRERHQLRTGPGGSDPQRLGPNGEQYYRVALQIGTAGARRLHYSRAVNGRIELSSVRLHDDLRT
jgi:hypothetical protein